MNAGSNPARRTKPTTWDYKRIAQRSTHRLADQNPPFLLTDSGDHPRHSLLLNSPESPTQINEHLTGALMKKSIMQDRPDTWAVMLAWLVTHKNEAGYSVLAFVMSILATSRGAKSKWKDRIAGATMCGILCFFAQPTLTAIWAIFNWNFPPELCWPISAGVGYVGVDSLFAYARRRLGLNEPGEKANADPQ